VTTTCEQYLHPGAVAEAALASGIRCVLTPGVFDVPRDRPGGTWQAHLAEACRIFDEMDGREGRLHVGFGPHAAYSLPPAGLAAVAQEAQRAAPWCRSTWPRPKPRAGWWRSATA
jgi:5-methylthioadenosine/S-adenosylhomocysteine deaminase